MAHFRDTVEQEDGGGQGESALGIFDIVYSISHARGGFVAAPSGSQF